MNRRTLFKSLFAAVVLRKIPPEEAAPEVSMTLDPSMDAIRVTCHYGGEPEKFIVTRQLLEDDIYLRDDFYRIIKKYNPWVKQDH